jgi:hypothetical protein
MAHTALPTPFRDWRSLPSALVELDELFASVSPNEANILAGHRARMQARLQQAQVVLA